MAQNITLMGASYPDVPSVVLPKTGGGTALFADPSGVTATASDVASGKYFLDSLGVLTAGTASGGGGASNIVTGTFKGTTANTAMDVTLSYTGSGYPIIVVICPTEGPLNSETGTYYNLVQRYAIAFYSVVKSSFTIAPLYNKSGDGDAGMYFSRYKSSASSATSYSVSSVTTTYYFYNNTAASTNLQSIVRIRSKTKMSVFIAGTSYGFAANIEYTYWVIYSS